MDADIRRATINRKLHLPNDKGYTNIISGELKLEEAVLHYNDFLDVLSSGPVVSNPSEEMINIVEMFKARRAKK